MLVGANVTWWVLWLMHAMAMLARLAWLCGVTTLRAQVT